MMELRDEANRRHIPAASDFFFFVEVFYLSCAGGRMLSFPTVIAIVAVSARGMLQAVSSFAKRNDVSSRLVSRY
jgi:hypothetical protein